MPAGAVYVGRPTRWGTPFFAIPYASEKFRHAIRLASDKACETNAEALEKYRTALLAGNLPVTVADVRRELRGKDLACWCGPEKVCHVDVLIEIANAAHEEQIAEVRSAAEMI